MSVRGTPTRFQSDRGEQLVAAAKQVATWDFKEDVQWAGRKGIEWTLVPTGGQHVSVVSLHWCPNVIDQQQGFVPNCH
jgi:hypothetical protein